MPADQHEPVPAARQRQTPPRWPRHALIVCVRWRTRRSRVWHNIPLACCSSVFTATKHIVERFAASRHAADYDPGSPLHPPCHSYAASRTA